jgi:hypothetical protein
MNPQFKSGKDNPNAGRIPATAAGFMLGFDDDEISVLVTRKILKPLGKPVPNATKYFARCYIESLMDDAEWLSKATQAIYDYHKDKNARTKKIPAQGGELIAVAA